DVKVAPEKAFMLFATRIQDWWPRGRTIGENPHVAIVLEPHAGGRWFEVDSAGNETIWGKVLAWGPPSRLLLGWQINSQWRYAPDLLTELELTFAPLASGGARVTLEHRNMERFGADAIAHRGTLDGGWPGMLGEFVKLAD